MGKFGYHVIDADGHGGDLPNWQSRLPKEYAAHWEERKARIAKQFANLIGVGVKETKGKARVDAGNRPGMTDPKARIEDMDLEGIDVEWSGRRIPAVHAQFRPGDSRWRRNAREDQR